jgi:hypothetical protein
MEVDHDQKVTLIDFEVTESKVRVTGFFIKKVCPLNCLRMLWSTVFIFGIELVYD